MLMDQYETERYAFEILFTRFPHGTFSWFEFFLSPIIFLTLSLFFQLLPLHTTIVHVGWPPIVWLASRTSFLMLSFVLILFMPRTTPALM
jgi:hypothetical protein